MRTHLETQGAHHPSLLPALQIVQMAISQKMKTITETALHNIAVLASKLNWTCLDMTLIKNLALGIAGHAQQTPATTKHVLAAVRYLRDEPHNLHPWHKN